MAAHVCAECGMMHDAPVSTESAEVAIARIQAEAQVKIAQLQARSDREANEHFETVAKIEANADVAVAEVQADAIVEALSADEADAEVVPGESGEPVVVVTDVDATAEPEVPAPPVVEETEHHEQRKPRGLGLW